MGLYSSIQRSQLLEIKTNLLSGFTVALALVPESIAFALIAHVSPLTGLYAAVVVCFVTAAFGGRPGMISGAAGSLAVVMVALVLQHGVEYLFATVVLMGILQIAFGLAKLGKFIRMVPYPVMLGFVNGLAIVIFVAQFSHFKIHTSVGDVWLSGKPLYLMIGLIATTIALIYLLPKLTKILPATLTAIFIVSIITAYFGIETKTVGDMGSIAGGLPKFHIPQVPLNLETLSIIFPYSLMLAAIGLIESLLTLNLIDEMTDTRGKPNVESLALGVSNVITGFIAGMGGCAMIGQSMINMNNGGFKRLAGITTSILILSFILFLSKWIEMIPIAALVGVMFVVSEKTFVWGSFRLFGKIPVPDIIVGIAVAAITVFANLAIAVIAGIIFSALSFAWQQAKKLTGNFHFDGNGRKIYVLEGTLFFASVATFQNIFTPHEDPASIIIDFKKARVIDHSALAAIEALAERYEVLQKKLQLKHLSKDCRELLENAKDLIEVNQVEDPYYRVIDKK